DFISIGLDLTPDEQREAIESTNVQLRRLENLLATIDPILSDVLSADERASLAKSIGEIRHAWAETNEEFGSRSREEQQFHLVVVAEHANRVRALLLSADEVISTRAKA